MRAGYVLHTALICTVLTDSVSHAVKKYPLVGVSWVISWLLGKAYIVTGLDADHRKEIKGDSNRFTGSNVLTIVV